MRVERLEAEIFEEALDPVDTFVNRPHGRAEGGRAARALPHADPQLRGLARDHVNRPVFTVESRVTDAEAVGAFLQGITDLSIRCRDERRPQLVLGRQDLERSAAY